MSFSGYLIKNYSTLFCDTLFLIKIWLFSAEFIIHLSEKHNTLSSFKKVLLENGAEFSDSFVENLLRIIQHMRPSLNSSTSNTKSSNPNSNNLAEKFPGLAIPNEPQKPLTGADDDSDGNDDKQNEKEEEPDATDKDVVDDLMAQFEADAPSNNQESKKEEKRKRSRSRERTRKRERDRSKSREKKRSRSRDRHRSRSRERNRNRYRDRSRRERSRSRHRRSSNDRSRRSRSRERRRSRERNRSRDRDRNRDSMDKHIRKENLELDDDPVPGKVKNYSFNEFFLFLAHFCITCLKALFLVLDKNL